MSKGDGKDNIAL